MQPAILEPTRDSIISGEGQQPKEKQERQESDLVRHFTRFREAFIAYRSSDFSVSLQFLASLLDDMVLYDLTDQERTKVPTVERRINMIRHARINEFHEIRRKYASKDLRVRHYTVLNNNILSQAIVEVSEALHRLIREREESVV